MTPPPHSAPQNRSIPSIAGGIIINKHFHKNSMKWKKVYFSSINAASKCAHFVFLTSVWFKTNNLWHMSYQRELLWLSAALLHNHNVMCWHTYLFIFKMTFFFGIYIHSACSVILQKILLIKWTAFTLEHLMYVCCFGLSLPCVDDPHWSRHFGSRQTTSFQSTYLLFKTLEPGLVYNVSLLFQIFSSKIYLSLIMFLTTFKDSKL